MNHHDFKDRVSGVVLSQTTAQGDSVDVTVDGYPVAPATTYPEIQAACQNESFWRDQNWARATVIPILLSPAVQTTLPVRLEVKLVDDTDGLWNDGRHLPLWFMTDSHGSYCDNFGTSITWRSLDQSKAGGQTMVYLVRFSTRTLDDPTGAAHAKRVAVRPYISVENSEASQEGVGMGHHCHGTNYYAYDDTTQNQICPVKS